MAKADFCFTYYDGDAARDMAHMNRLERGAYSDIIISQRKFGHLSKDQIKKILGKDFDDCFGSIELVLKKDEKNLFFIDWLEQSEKKAKMHSKRQSDNRSGKTKQQPKSDLVTPLGDGNEDEVVIADEIVLKYESFEKKFESAFDEITLEKYRMSFPNLDLTAELSHFMLKCNSAKSEYHTRDPNGLRLGFLTQLKNSKSFKQDGKIKNTNSAEIIKPRTYADKL